MITQNNNMSKERDTLIWLDGVLDAIYDDDSIKFGGDNETYVKITRKTFERIRQRIAKDLENKIENQTLLRG